MKNLLAGIAIIFDDRYSIGDNVKINGFQGDVISLGLQTTKIKAYTGEVFIIGNSSINEVINYSLNASKLIIDIPISYDIDLDKLDNVMNEIKEKVSKLDNVIGNVELLGIEEFNDSSIKYRMVLDCKSMCQFGVKRNILKMVKEDFNKNKKQEEMMITLEDVKSNLEVQALVKGAQKQPKTHKCGLLDIPVKFKFNKLSI